MKNKNYSIDKVKDFRFLEMMTSDLKMHSVSQDMRVKLLDAMTKSIVDNVSLLVEVYIKGADGFEAEFLEVDDGNLVVSFGDGHCRLLPLSNTASFEVKNKLNKTFFRENKLEAPLDNFIPESDLKAFRNLLRKVENKIPAYAEISIPSVKDISTRVVGFDKNAILCSDDNDSYIDIFYLEGLRRIKERELELIG